MQTTDKHCSACRHFISATDRGSQNDVYGQNTLIDSCRLRGTVLSAPSMTNEQVTEMQGVVAGRCADFNRSVTKTQITLNLGIGTPPAHQGKRQPVGSCRACTYFVQPPLVEETFGINLGLCVKFGKLVPGMKASDIARSCSASSRVNAIDPKAHQRTLLESFELDPILSAYMGVSYVTAQNNSNADYFTPPEEITATDRELSEEDKKNGIRAWRKIEWEGFTTYLPIFEESFFSEAERRKIPRTGDDEHPEHYLDHQSLTYQVAALWMDLDDTPMLMGIAGTGKTEFFRFMAWLMGLPFERFSITSSSEIDDLAGKMHLETQKIEATATTEEMHLSRTVFKMGRIPQAWQKPCVILIDEPNVGPPEVWQFLRPLVDNSKQLVLDMSEGERIERSPYTFLGMAANPAWDVRNVGAQTISDADGSRLSHIAVSLPTEDMEVKIIKDRCAIDQYDIPDKTVDVIMKIAKDLRAMSDDEAIPVTWGIRQQIKVARASRAFPLAKCYQLAIADLLEPSVRDTILDVVNQYNSIRGTVKPKRK